MMTEFEFPKTALKDSIGWDELTDRWKTGGRLKRLRRFVVFAHEDEWFIAMRGFHLFRNAQRYADQLKADGLTTETKIRDSVFEGPYLERFIYPEGMLRP